MVVEDQNSRVRPPAPRPPHTPALTLRAQGFILGAPAGGRFRWVGAASRISSKATYGARAVVLSSRDW